MRHSFSSIQFLALSALVIYVACCGQRSPYLDREIHGPLEIEPEGTEITAVEPLKAERQVNILILDFGSSYIFDPKTNQLHLPNGRAVSIEVELIDQDGMKYELAVEFLDRTSVGYVWREKGTNSVTQLPQKEFTKVRLKASDSVQCAKIIWRSYNQRDRK